MKKGPRNGSHLHLTESSKLAVATVTSLYLHGYLRFPIPDDLDVVESDTEVYADGDTYTWIEMVATNYKWPLLKDRHILQEVLLSIESRSSCAYCVSAATFWCAPRNEHAALRAESLVGGECEFDAWPKRLSEGFRFGASFRVSSEQVFQSGKTFHPDPLHRSSRSVVFFDTRVRPQVGWLPIGKPKKAVKLLNTYDAYELYRQWLDAFAPSLQRYPSAQRYAAFRVGYDAVTDQVLVHAPHLLVR